MKPAPANGEAYRELAVALLEAYRDPMTRACQRVLIILANKKGSVSLGEVAKAVRLPAALDVHVLPAVVSSLTGLGLISPARPKDPNGPRTPTSRDACYELADEQAAFRWLIGGISPPTKSPPARSGGEAAA